MKFEKVPQQVLKLKDIKSLVETLRVEINRDLVMVFDLEDHSQRLLQSITELNFKFPKNICKDDFNLFLMNQIKNKLQYDFHRTVSFTKSQRKKNLQLMRFSDEIYKLRLIYSNEAFIDISIEPYLRDLNDASPTILLTSQQADEVFASTQNKTWEVLVLKKDEFHIESTNPIWQHKFLPRPDFSYFLNQGYDEVLWLDENENLCEGSFTAIIFDGNKTPLANNLPSISIKQIHNLTKAQCKVDSLEKLQLVNSLIGVVDARIINHK